MPVDLRRRKASRLGGLGGILLLAAACASTPDSLQTLEGRAAFHANAVAERLVNVELAVIAANQTGALPDDTAILAVRGIVSALKVIRETPHGWLASVERSWAETKGALGDRGRTDPNLVATITLVDALLVTVRSGGAR
jgi:hypothetical protein